VEAIPILEEALRLRQSKLGPDHPDTFKSVINLAQTLETADRLSEAEVLWNTMLAVQRRRLAADDLGLAETLTWLGVNLRRQQRFAEAEPLFRESLAIREKRGPADWLTSNTRSQLGSTLASLKQYAEAESLLLVAFEELMARESQIPAKSRARTIDAAGQRIVQLYRAWGQPEKAKEWTERLKAAADHKARPKSKRHA
jgi:tetratricopeptide (TPR) repeat protein